MKIKQKEMYMSSLLTAGFIASMLSKDSKIPTYEDLFEADTEEYRLKQMQNLSAQLKNYAEKANEQRRLRDGRRKT